MNSDLVYKKKYLKYKSKYIALQRQLNVQEGGWPSLTTFSSKSKLGIYLFFINDKRKYDNNLLDEWKLLKEVYFKDSGSEISKVLGDGCYYVERKTNILKSDFKLGRLAVTKSFTLISCKDGTKIDIPSEDFSNENNGVSSIQNILNLAKQNVSNLTHYFVVDFNALKYNRISCLFEMPGPAFAPQSATTYDATAALQKLPQPVVQNLPPGAPGYGAPPQGYGAPPQGYGAPPQGYGAPPQGYGAPPQGYGAPPQGYGAPPQGAPQASAPPEDLSSIQLTQLKQIYNNPQYTDQYWQELWQENWRTNLQYYRRNITPDEFVQFQLSQQPR
jgi:hypothetical protein